MPAVLPSMDESGRQIDCAVRNIHLTNVYQSAIVYEANEQSNSVMTQLHQASFFGYKL
jgi:hypothetical protein